jgi:hypothetical protein
MSYTTILKEGLSSDWIEKGRTYFLFGHGTGDTFNALLGIKAAGLNNDVDFIVPKYQAALVAYLCERLELPVQRVYSIDFFSHSHVNTLPAKHPEFRFEFGFPRQRVEPGIQIVWLAPRLYPRHWRLNEDDLLRLRSRIVHDPAPSPIELPGKTALLFTSMSAGIRYEHSLWTNIARGLGDKGYRLYANESGNSHYGNEGLEGVSRLALSHPEILRLVYRHPHDLVLVGLRSGIFDLFRLSENKGLIFYPSNPTWMWGECRLEHVGYSRLRAQEVLLPRSFTIDGSFIEAMLLHF